jgi:hypothetical protein
MTILKILILSAGIDLNQYEIFSQIQLTTKIDDVIDPVTGLKVSESVDYFVADFLLVKKTKIAGVEVLDLNNVIALETKLSIGTDLTIPQKSALAKVKSADNSFDIRSIKANGKVDISKAIGSGTLNNQVNILDYIKVWSDGTGRV